MAQDRHYRSLNSLEGLGSIHSCLDGVPFKISSKFLPPDKVYVPQDLLTPSKCSLLDQQYSFETEEGVLAWIRAKEEMKRRQKVEAEERRVKELEEFTKGKDSDSDLEETDDFMLNPSSINLSNESNIASTSQAQKAPPLIPNFDQILTPTPIMKTSSSSSMDTQPKKTSIDLSMFEKEKDAFENLDLQAINEMEELKNLFQDSSAIKPSSSPMNEIKTKGHKTSENDNPMVKPVAKPRSKVPESNSPSLLNIDPNNEGDYVTLQMNYAQNSVVFNNNTSHSTTNNNNNSLGGKYMANSKLYKPVLPPIVPNSQTELKPTMNGLNGVNMSLGAPSMVQSEAVYSNSQPMNNLQKNGTNENILEGGLRSAKSNPDLSQTPLPSISPRLSMSHTPPPIPQRSTDTSNDYENWNLKKKPIPPLPPPKPTIWPNTSESCVNNSPKETDPYSTLCKQDQLFVNGICSMGFARPRVSRAVDKLGRDEKEVIDHLFHLDNLIAKGYPLIKSESALLLFNNKIDKASSYIDMFTQFEELGFHADKIRDALIKNDVDRDKALDELMAS